MNKNQIKEELRRSACESVYPLGSLITNFYDARLELNSWLSKRAIIYDLSDNSRRIFMLLVAEAL